MKVTPRRIAAASRALQGTLRDALALRSDDLSAELARLHQAVPWDRQRLIGQVQQSLWELADERFAPLKEGAPGVRVLERADQPYECIEVAWRQLRRGLRVWVEQEPGASVGGIDLLRAMGEVLGYEVLRVAAGAPELPDEIADWPCVGVDAAPRRVVAVHADADPELAAYLVARASLRRSGFDPRCTHRVIVAGDHRRFERHLRRLFVGVRFGPPVDAEAFAGPVSAAAAQAYEADLQAWREGSGFEELCPGGRLEAAHSGPDSVYLAPALFAAEGEELRGPQGDPRGPILLLQRVESESLEPTLRAALATGEGPSAWIWISETKPRLKPGPKDRWVSGALAVSRLPPGLPMPRP